jgi:hypothetical protein
MHGPVWAELFDTLERHGQLVAELVSNRLLPSFGHHRGGSPLYDEGSPDDRLLYYLESSSDSSQGDADEVRARIAFDGVFDQMTG